MTVSRCGKLTHMSHDQIWSKLNCQAPVGLIESYLTANLGFPTR